VASFQGKLNEVLGDYHAHYKYSTGVNQVIQDFGLGSSANLLKIVCSLLILWAT